MPGLGWTCSVCTFEHSFPGTRCVMCHTLRTTKDQMANFIKGVPIPESAKVNATTVSSTTVKSTGGSAKAKPAAEPAKKPPAAKKKTAATTKTKSLQPKAAPKENITIDFFVNKQQQQQQQPKPAASVASAAASTVATNGTSATAQNPYASSAIANSVSTTSAGNSLNATSYPNNHDRSNAVATENNNSTTIATTTTATTTANRNPQYRNTATTTHNKTKNNNKPTAPSKSSKSNRHQSNFNNNNNINNNKSGHFKPKIVVRYTPGPVTLDESKISHWIFPIHNSYSKRKYQVDISRSALFDNTLVSLPTGLGKTFIAAVVMYNFHRWFPEGKIIFCAPTLPLVTQQAKAIFKIVGIPAKDTAILTGKTSSKEREAYWHSHRVFYCTPQTVQNDLNNSSMNMPSSKVVCLVLDEAHKASGDHAYVKVTELLRRAGSRFRLLGLSATPGSDIKSVQELVSVLQFSKIECRRDEDPDIKPFTYHRNFELVDVEETSLVIYIRNVIVNCARPSLSLLNKNGFLLRANSGDTTSSFSVVTEKQIFAARQRGGDPQCNPELFHYFETVYRLIAWRESIDKYGIGDFRRKVQEYLAGPRMPKPLLEAMDCEEWKDMWDQVQGETNNTQGNMDASRLLSKNPKMMKLKEILCEHFERAKAVLEKEQREAQLQVVPDDNAKQPHSTRAIVFSQFRNSVSEIVSALSDSKPLIRATPFVGQSKGKRKEKGGGDENGNISNDVVDLGMNQNGQQRVIEKFQQGEFNVLVCTSIGEEGLDIGQVDLIVLFDSLKSPIRNLQRVGRTGRHRDGLVVSLVTKAEKETQKEGKNKERTLERALKDPNKFAMTPCIPMFPTDRPLPKMLEKSDLCDEKGVLRLSQVGGTCGHGGQKRIQSGGKVGSERKKRRRQDDTSWKLTNQEEQHRSNLLGRAEDQCCSNDTTSTHGFPMTLRARFLKARLMSFSAQTPVDLSRFKLGSTLNILRTIQEKHGDRYDPSKAISVRSFLHDEQAMQSLFPVKKEMATTRSLISSISRKNVGVTDGTKRSESRSENRQQPIHANESSILTHKKRDKSIQQSHGIVAQRPSAKVSNPVRASSLSSKQVPEQVQVTSSQRAEGPRPQDAYPTTAKVPAPVASKNVVQPAIYKNPYKKTTGSNQCNTTNISRMGSSAGNRPIINPYASSSRVAQQPNVIATGAAAAETQFQSSAVAKQVVNPPGSNTGSASVGLTSNTFQQSLASNAATRQLNSHFAPPGTKPGQPVIPPSANLAGLRNSTVHVTRQYSALECRDGENNASSTTHLFDNELSRKPQEKDCMLHDKLPPESDNKVDKADNEFFLPTQNDSDSSISEEEEEEEKDLAEGDGGSAMKDDQSTESSPSLRLNKSRSKNVNEQLGALDGKGASNNIAKNIIFPKDQNILLGKQSSASDLTATRIIIEHIPGDIPSGEKDAGRQENEAEDNHDGPECHDSHSLRLPTQNSSSSEDDSDAESAQSRENDADCEKLSHPLQNSRVEKEAENTHASLEDDGDESEECFNDDDDKPLISLRENEGRLQPLLQALARYEDAPEEDDVDTDIKNNIRPNKTTKKKVDPFLSQCDLSLLPNTKTPKSGRNPIETSHGLVNTPLELTDTPHCDVGGGRDNTTKHAARDLADTPLDRDSSLSGDIDKVVCAICLSSEVTDSNDPIIRCTGPRVGSTCDLSVHFSCYSDDKKQLTVKDSVWRCDQCDLKFQLHVTKEIVGQNDERFVRCCVCHRDDGPLKRVSRKIWSHPHCLQWCGNSPADNDKICTFCHLKGAVQCGGEGCNICVHPFCAVTSISSSDQCSLWTLVGVQYPPDQAGMEDQEACNNEKKYSLVYCPRDIDAAQSVVETFANGDQIAEIKVIPPDRFCKSAAKHGTEPGKGGTRRLKRLAAASDIQKCFMPLGVAGANKGNRALVDVDEKPKHDSDDDSEVSRRERKRARMERRKMALRFIDDEAEDDGNDDDDEEQDVAAIEADEMSVDSFINDSSQLGYTQDQLGRIDPDATGTTSSAASHYEDEGLHRRIFNQRAKQNQFATPMLNRKMQRNSLTPSNAPSSERGLGKMHFVRSVLEHCRNGGDADDIEDFYNEMEKENAEETSPQYGDEDATNAFDYGFEY